MSSSKGLLTLPENPNLEQLREQAKERLDVIRTDTPEAQLAEAQLLLARDYGFPSWRELKAEVDRLTGAVNGLVGHYLQDVSNRALSVSVKGRRVFLESSKGAVIELVPQPEGGFAIPGLMVRHRFERDSTGKARALIVKTERGGEVRAERISAEKAAQLRAEFERAVKAEWPIRTAIEVSGDMLERCVGYYANPLGEVLQFSREDRKLFMESAGPTRVPLDAESETDFFVNSARLEFHFRIEGDVAASVVSRRMGTDTVLSRISPEAAANLHSAVVQRAAEQAQPRQLAAPVPHEILARYAGRYRIVRGLEMVFEVQEGRIFAQIFRVVGKSPRLEIFPESETKFFWTAMAAQASFFLDAEGKVSHGVWHQGGHLLPLIRLAEPPAEAVSAA
jgi:hypothetical protein